MIKKLTMAALLAASCAAHATSAPLNCINYARLEPSLTLQQAERNLQSTRGGDPLAEADAMYSLAEVKYGVRDVNGGDDLLNQAAAIWTAQPASKELVLRLQQQAQKRSNLNQCKLVAPMLRAALTLAERAPQADQALTYSVLTDLVLVDIAQRNLPAVTQNAPRLLAWWQQHGDPADAVAAPVYRKMIDLYLKQEQYALAEPLALRNLKNGEQAYGAEHGALIGRLDDLASAYYGQLRYDEGENATRRAAAIYAQANPAKPERMGATAPKVEVAMRRLVEQGKMGAALSVGEQEQKQLEQLVDANANALLGATKAREAQVPGTLQANAAEQAEKRARAKLMFSEKSLAAARVRVAELLHAQQRYDQAQALYLQALEGYARSSAEALDAAAAKSDLAMLYRARGDLAAAERLQNEALELMLPAYGSLHPDVVDSAHELVLIYRHQGKQDAAASVIARVPAAGQAR